MKSIGVLGDLCRETEWIEQRMKGVSRSIACCKDIDVSQPVSECKKTTESRPDAIITLVDATMIVEGVALSRSEKALGMIWMY